MKTDTKHRPPAVTPYGLIGRSLSHSLSPNLHRVLGSHPYSLFEMEEEELESFLRDAPFSGVNVTIPYKEKAHALCDELTTVARLCGNVNTVVKDHTGRLLGDNTDFAGFKRALLQTGFSPRGKTAMILGTGGAAKTVGAVLKEMGAETIFFVSRSGKPGTVNYGEIGMHPETAILVNATPVGMSPSVDAMPTVDLSRLPSLELVFDLIYNPLRTRLIQAAEDLGIRTENGLSMLIGQAAAAAERFLNTDRRAEELMLRRDLSRPYMNIVLIGMPGVGKTTIGRELARRLERPFFDTDRMIEEANHLSVPAFIETMGIDAFREEEARIIRLLRCEKGAVIATGGGSILNPANMTNLRMNGRLVRLARALTALSTDGRPLSLTTGIEALAAEREPLYARYADITLEITRLDAALSELTERFS